MPKLGPNTPPLLLALAASLSGLSCSGSETTSSSSSGSGSSAVITSVAIDPADFLGDVPCSALAGGMHSYVATITDRTDPAHAFTLPSSPPTSCSQPTSFRYVLADHSYTARIDGYAELPSKLVPLGGELSGSPHLLRRTASGTEPVEPRWTTSCGEVGQDAATTAVAHRRVLIGNCDPLVDHAAPSGMAIIIHPAGALSAHGCTDSGGQAVTVDLTPVDSMLPAVTGITCGSPSITYTSSITAGRTYTFYLHDPASTALGALCFATPHEGVTVLAVCDPLSPFGAIAVDPAPLFASKGYACQKDILTYQATMLGGPQSVYVPCQEALRFELIAPGDYEVTLKAYIPAEGKELQASCTGTVYPGRTSQAVCSAP